jgi:protocatechuate 3,4-dioxygenase beta subunit
VVLKVTLTIVDVAAGCNPLADRAVYIWHCDQNGNYSLYSPANGEREISAACR